MDLPFAEVSPKVYHFKGKAANYQHHSRDSIFLWPLIQACGHVEHGRRHFTVPPKEVYLFITWPGEECEEANFGLAKYPRAIKLRDEKISTNLNGWRWGSFCKTHYASKISMEHFLRCHFSVCQLLKEAEKLGLLEYVKDEGEFWNRRDFEALAREVLEWNHMTQGIAERLKATFGGKNVLSPIDG